MKIDFSSFKAQMSKENYQLKTCPPFIVKYAQILTPKLAYFYYRSIITAIQTYIPKFAHAR